MPEDSATAKEGVVGLEDIYGEQAATKQDERTPSQILNPYFSRLNVLKREDETKYQEYLDKIAPEIRRIYLESKGNMPPSFEKKMREEALRHGMDLSVKPEEVRPETRERLTQSSIKARQQIGRKGITRVLEALKNLRNPGETRLEFFRRISRKEQEKTVPRYPSEEPTEIPIKNK